MNRTLIYFLLFGPVAGGFGFVLTDQLVAAAGFSSSLLSVPESFTALWATVPILWLYSLILAYPVGALPVLLCGLTYEKLLSLKPRTSIVAHAFLGSISGFTVSALLGSMFVYNSDSGNPLILILPWGIAGLLGGLIPALICYKLKLNVD
jgi:hypothetical protein